MVRLLRKGPETFDVVAQGAKIGEIKFHAQGPNTIIDELKVPSTYLSETLDKFLNRESTYRILIAVFPRENVGLKKIYETHGFLIRNSGQNWKAVKKSQ